MTDIFQPPAGIVWDAPRIIELMDEYAILFTGMPRWHIALAGVITYREDFDTIMSELDRLFSNLQSWDDTVMRLSVLGYELDTVGCDDESDYNTSQVLFQTPVQREQIPSMWDKR